MKKVQDSAIRWGIVGVGDVCEVKSAPAMQLIAQSSIAAVMRRNEEKVKDYARRHGISKWYTDATALINDPEVNAIYIATPPYVHEAYTLEAAAAGKPVYVEKPMARTYEECARMQDNCEKAGVPLYVAYYRRTLPNFLKVKELVENGAIGSIRSVSLELFKSLQPDIIAQTAENWRVDPEISGGGYFFDLASHQLDLLDYIFGPIQKVAGFSANQAGRYSAEDIVSATFRFENGIIGNGIWCFTANSVSEKEQAIIVGSEGQISFEFFGKPEVVLETPQNGRETFRFEMPKHIQQPLIQTVVDDLLGLGHCPSTGATAARTNAVMDQITS